MPLRRSPRKSLGLEIQGMSKENNVKKTTKKSIDKNQMIIDAGQKLVEVKSCTDCSFVYNPGNKQDDDAHDKNHFIAHQGKSYNLQKYFSRKICLSFRCHRLLSPSSEIFFFFGLDSIALYTVPWKEFLSGLDNSAIYYDFCTTLSSFAVPKGLESTCAADIFYSSIKVF